MKQLIQSFTPLLLLLVIMTCEDQKDKYGSVEIRILINRDNTNDNGQKSKSIMTFASNVTKITIIISGVDPIEINVSSGQTVTQTIEGVPIGIQTVTIYLKDENGITLYTQTQSVRVEAGKTASPIFPAEGFTAENVEITVTSPNGNEEWEMGSTQEITWASSNVSGNVKIELYKSGSAYQTIYSSETNDGIYSWAIPSTYNESSNYKVRIESINDNSIFDESDNNFSLVSPPSNITVNTPNGGEEWELGSSHEITWSSNDVSGNVKIELYEGGSVYQYIANNTENDGSYSWTIPSTYNESSNYKVRITSVNDDSIFDESNSSFSLYSPSSIVVTSPNGGEEWGLGSTHEITWISNDVSGNVKIELNEAGSVYQYIAGNTENDGSYSWTIPSTYNESSNYKVRITSVNDDSIFDESDNNFSLSIIPYITVITPNGGEVWYSGEQYQIIWDTNIPAEYVGISLWRGNSPVLTIASGIYNDGSYAWYIPLSTALANNYRIEIYSINSNTSDMSNSFFSIQ